MRLLIQNMLMEATIDLDSDPPMLLLEYEQSPIEPAMAQAHGFVIAQATDEERRALADAGYQLPDHDRTHAKAA